MLFAIVRRGKKAGLRLVPHRHEDDRYRLTLGKKGTWIPIADVRDIPDYLANGYSLSMSSGAQRQNPSLINLVQSVAGNSLLLRSSAQIRNSG